MQNEHKIIKSSNFAAFMNNSRTSASNVVKFSGVTVICRNDLYQFDADCPQNTWQGQQNTFNMIKPLSLYENLSTYLFDI